MKTNIAMIILGLLLSGCGTANKKAQVMPSPFEATYDVYANVLGEYVRHDAVDYAGLQQNRADLDKFIGQLAGLTMEEYDSMNSEEQLALWINAYNAVMLRTVIDAYPTPSIKDIAGARSDVGWLIAGKTVTLDNICDDILRSEFEDARTLLALSCASIDGPVLLPVPFRGETIDDQLDSVAYAFVNDVDRNKINPHTSVVTTSEIFSWYGDDFIHEFDTEDFGHLQHPERAVLNFIFTYIDDSVTEFIDESAEWTVEYRTFDWSLNDAKN